MNCEEGRTPKPQTEDSSADAKARLGITSDLVRCPSPTGIIV